MFSIYQRRQVCGLGASYVHREKGCGVCKGPFDWALRPWGGCGLISRGQASPAAGSPGHQRSWWVTLSTASARGLQSGRGRLAAGSGTHRRASVAAGSLSEAGRGARKDRGGWEVASLTPCGYPPGVRPADGARRGLSRAEAGRGLGWGWPPLPRLSCAPWRSLRSAACAHGTETLPPWRWSHRCTLPPVCPPLPTPPGPFQNPSAFLSRTAEQSAKGAAGCRFPDFYQTSLGTAGLMSPGAGLSLPSGPGGHPEVKLAWRRPDWMKGGEGMLVSPEPWRCRQPPWAGSCVS